MSTPASPKDIAPTEGDESRADQKTGQPIGEESLSLLADAVVLRVCEYDDRTSPEDWPEALLITPEELHGELLSFAQAIIERLALPSGGGGGSEKDNLARDLSPTPQAKDASEGSPVAVDYPWIEWNGGDCPIAHGQRVQVRYDNGDESAWDRGSTFNRQRYLWNLAGPHRIAAYRTPDAKAGTAQATDLEPKNQGEESARDRHQPSAHKDASEGLPGATDYPLGGLDAIKRRCREEWDNVNDPPCHPGDADWRPCPICIPEPDSEVTT